MPDLSDQIETAAEKPKKAASPLGSMESQPIPDLIEADKYLAGKEALTGTNAQGGAKSGWGCLRPARAIPPGSV